MEEAAVLLERETEGLSVSVSAGEALPAPLAVTVAVKRPGVAVGG